MADQKADVGLMAQMMRDGDMFVDEDGVVSLKPPRNPQRAHIVESPSGGPWPVMPRLRPKYEPASTNEFALSDKVEDKTGSKLAGTIVDKTAKVGRVVGNTAAELTMIPSVYRAVDQASDAAATGIGKGVDLATMLMEKSKGALSSEAQAQEPQQVAQAETGANPAAKDPLEVMLADRSKLIAQRDKAQAELDLQVKGGTKDGKRVSAGRGVDYTRAADTITSLTAQVNDLNTEIKKEQQRRDPVYKQQVAKMDAAETGLKKDLDEAPKSFYNEHPTLAKWWNIAPIAVAGVTAALAQGADVIGSRFGARQWRKALDAAAAPGATLQTERISRDVSNRIAQRGRFSPDRSEGWKYGALGTIGALEGMGVSNFPAYYDSNLPHSNPRRDAYLEFIKRLPAGEVGDAEKAKAEGIIKEMPEKNPDRAGAMEYFNSPLSVILRTGLGGIEGAGTALGMTKVVGAAGPSDAALSVLRARTHALDQHVQRSNRQQNQNAAAAAAAAAQANQAANQAAPAGNAANPQPGPWANQPRGQPGNPGQWRRRDPNDPNNP